MGGWWNIVLGKRPQQFQAQNAGIRNLECPESRGRGNGNSRDRESVEERINGLAQALGMPPADLASAIAVAVRQYVPPASLSSVAAKESGPAVEAMLRGESDEEMQRFKLEHEQVHATGAAGHTSGVMSGVVSGMESFVGMDEP